MSKLRVVLAALLFASAPALADDVARLSIADPMAMPETSTAPGNTVAFSFGDQPHGQVAQSFGSFVASPKTNAFAKSGSRVCERVFLSAPRSPREHAIQAGGDAAIGIESHYKKSAFSSATAYECHKGLLLGGLALRGEVVRLAGR